MLDNKELNEVSFRDFINHINENKKKLKSRADIIKAIDDDKIVFCNGGGYKVIKDNKGQYLIKSMYNNSVIGLGDTDDTLNASDFFINENGATVKETVVENEISFKDYIEKVRKEQINVIQFNEFIDNKRSMKNIPYLNEAENSEVEKWVRLFEEECGGDINNLDESWLGKLVGGAAGFVIGPSIGRIIANALGVDRGVLYDMFTSRVVSAALGVALAKGLGGEYKN